MHHFLKYELTSPHLGDLKRWIELNNKLNCPLKDIACSNISSPSFNIFTVTQPRDSVIDTATEALIAAPETVPTTGTNLITFPTALRPRLTTTNSFDKFLPKFSDHD